MKKTKINKRLIEEKRYEVYGQDSTKAPESLKIKANQKMDKSMFIDVVISILK